MELDRVGESSHGCECMFVALTGLGIHAGIGKIHAVTRQNLINLPP